MYTLTVSLPPQGHKARESLDLDNIAELLSPENRGKLPFLRHALITGRRWLEKNRRYGARSVTYVCIKHDCSVVLEEIGPRGGHRTLWTFGKFGQ